MNLKDILTGLVESGEAVLLNDSTGDWQAGTLLENLSPQKLNRPAHIQPGLYIAEIDTGGYLGRVLYKVKQNA